MAATAPSLPRLESSESIGFNPDFSTPTNGTTPADGPTSPVDGATHVPSTAPAPASAPAPAIHVQPSEKQQETQDPQIQQKVKDVMYSDIGVNTLLNRLKASIASARDFASFLKRRGAIEEEQANSLKKLSRLTLENLHKAEARHESYQQQFEQVMHANERIADHGTQFGLALHAMHENLLQLSNKMDLSRKELKHQGLAAEKKVQDAESLAEKAKAKYNQLAEDLDRVKTGDTGAGRKFGIKGPKSAAQHEEDLQKKLKLADEDYASKVRIAQTNRRELESTSRPQSVTALVELIKELDAALTMEMQKFASFNEKLVVNNGQVVSPQALKGSTTQPPPSINNMVYQINNDRDFNDYILKHAAKIPSVRSELQYVKHPTQAGGSYQQPPTASPANNANRRSSTQIQSQPPPAFSVQPPTQSPQSHQTPFPEPTQQPGFQSYNPSFVQQQQQQQPYQQQSSQSQPPAKQNPYSSDISQYPGQAAYSPVAQNPYGQNDYAGGLAGQSMVQQSSGVIGAHTSGPPINPIFGVTLDELFARDGSPVPMVVYQCIQAVDLYGLEVEGIYRIPGTTSHIQEMKALFDRDASQIDFRNPEAFRHDVNSVAGLLKQFFRELPDPLLTLNFYGKFIDAARIEDETMRRDSMHALINDLPDPNYATLRALVLHLYRVQASSEVNRMSTANLGICWAPSIMGPHKGNNMADAGLQARVIITILDNVLQIFDED
ncbi:Rho GTPase-like protein activator [Aaosphaeria arxii CBS 175.79]|uniref:Rho GTPase-like protein activator n=1 Tax=Aaosphaeria arxii CBS 175.79 TaxID=1450172 RepID=A0A6A5Y934_9PLEO|nr:Rho GTPase-like protein activator [Aaosphaeria arxii CBS 175.79]KAF2021743.1 Rho GTPase-like protein activator [Aaosphaeria arxii CBS 175.79]